MGEKPEVKDEPSTTQPVSLIKRKGPQPVSGILLRAYFEGTEAQRVSDKVAAIEGSQLAHLFKSFPVTDFQTMKSAIKEYKDLSKVANVVPKTAKTRAGEIQALYGAFRWAEYQPVKAGYHAAVAEARRLLTEKSLKWDGGKVRAKWEKQIEAEVMTDAEIELETRKDMKRLEMQGLEVTEAMVEEVRAKHFAEMQNAEMRNLASALVKKYGVEKSEQLSDHLIARITAAQQEAVNAAATKEREAAAA